MEYFSIVTQYLSLLFEKQPEIATLAILNFATFAVHAIRTKKIISSLKSELEGDINAVGSRCEKNREEARLDRRDIWKKVSKLIEELATNVDRTKMHADHFDQLDIFHKLSLKVAWNAKRTADKSRIISERAITKVDSKS